MGDLLPDPFEPAGLYSDPCWEEVRAAHRRPASRPSPPRCARSVADRSTRAAVGEDGRAERSGAGASPSQSIGIERLAASGSLTRHRWLVIADQQPLRPAPALLALEPPPDVLEPNLALPQRRGRAVHQRLAEACVIGVAHPKWDEWPLLFIVRSQGSSLDKDAVFLFLKDKIATWWMPDDVLFVDELPHTATGKLYKSVLREQYKAYILPTAEAAPAAATD